MTYTPPRGFPRQLKTFTLLKLRRTIVSTNILAGRISSRYRAYYETLLIQTMTLIVNGKTSSMIVQPTPSRYGSPAYR